MRNAKVRSVVFADTLYSSGSRILLVILTLAVMGAYFYQEGLNVLDNWENETYWSSV